MLIRAYRVMGHLVADLDPLGITERKVHQELRPETYGFTDADLDRPIFIDKVLGLETATVRQILRILRRTYCRQIGVEFMHITSPQQKRWIQERIEGETKDVRFTNEGKKAILPKLIEAESFEKFADVKYTGTKRFGLEGAETLVPALEQIIKRGGQLGLKEIVIGMAHRGRLNVLANVMGKPLRAIFNEFKGGSFKPDDVEGSGDVKYHLGASSDREFDGNKVHLSLTANPSHLEIVDPVVLGKVRAKQDQLGCQPGQRTPVLPLLIHGDAAFAGQGVVAECFGLSGLKAIAPAARSISSSTTRSDLPPTRAIRVRRPIARTSPRWSRRRSSTSTATTRKPLCTSPRSRPSSACASRSRSSSTWSAIVAMAITSPTSQASPNR